MFLMCCGQFINYYRIFYLAYYQTRVKSIQITNRRTDIEILQKSGMAKISATCIFFNIIQKSGSMSVKFTMFTITLAVCSILVTKLEELSKIYIRLQDPSLYYNRE